MDARWWGGRNCGRGVAGMVHSLSFLVNELKKEWMIRNMEFLTSCIFSGLFLGILQFYPDFRKSLQYLKLITYGSFCLIGFIFFFSYFQAIFIDLTLGTDAPLDVNIIRVFQGYTLFELLVEPYNVFVRKEKFNTLIFTHHLLIFLVLYFTPALIAIPFLALEVTALSAGYKRLAIWENAPHHAAAASTMFIAFAILLRFPLLLAGIYLSVVHQLHWVVAPILLLIVWDLYWINTELLSHRKYRIWFRSTKTKLSIRLDTIWRKFNYRPAIQKLFAHPLPLLIIQQFFVGNSLILLFSAANAIFLLTYDSSKIPYTYVGIGLVGIGISYAIGYVREQWSLVRLSSVIYLSLTLLFMICYTLITLRWISFALVIISEITIAILMTVMGLQSVRLFNLDEIKEAFPLLLAGQVFGLIVMGAAMNPLLVWVKETENLLLIAIATHMVSFALLLLHFSRFRTSYRSVQRHQFAGIHERHPLVALWRKPYPRLLLTYQFFSNLGTKSIAFLALSVIGLQFDTSIAIAGFFGNLSAVITVLTLCFLIFLSSRLIRRFGLRLGLLANPLGVNCVLLPAIVIAGVWGIESTSFFWFVIATFSVDFILSGGMTATAVRNAYKVLPAEQQDSIETLLAGFINPLGFGVAGLLLIIQNNFNFGLSHIVVVTVFICIIWTIVAWHVFKNYLQRLSL